VGSDWKSYNDLAWTEDWFASREELDEEAQIFIRFLEDEKSSTEKTMLHLGCGAGGYEFVFKNHYEVTGVDISKGMLDLARTRHSDVEYLEDDMRTVNLDRQFDVVLIPDGIDYMTTVEDLKQAINNAVSHLKPGGKLLVVCKTAESFKENNFVYTGEKDGIHITLFENNHRLINQPEIYEAALCYMIREGDDLSFHTEKQTLGLFPLATWEQILTDAGLSIKTESLDDLYDDYVMEDGEYKLTVFVGDYL